MRYSPNDECKAIEEEQIAKHEQGIGNILHSAQKRKFRGIVRRYIEHAELVSGLTCGCVEMKIVHQYVA
jgi:hypothetical protein